MYLFLDSFSKLLPVFFPFSDCPLPLLQKRTKYQICSMSVLPIVVVLITGVPKNSWGCFSLQRRSWRICIFTNFLSWSLCSQPRKSMAYRTSSNSYYVYSLIPSTLIFFPPQIPPLLSVLGYIHIELNSPNTLYI